MKVRTCFLISVLSLAAGILHSEPAPVSFAIVGLVHDHARGFIPPTGSRRDIQLVAIVEPNRELAARYAKDYKLAASLFHTNLESMLDQVKPQAVATFTSTFDHGRLHLRLYSLATKPTTADQILSGEHCWVAVYLLGGWLALDVYPNPLPASTKFDGRPNERQIYLRAYDSGYQRSKMGWSTSGPLSERVTAEDFGRTDGQAEGDKAFHRMLGSESRPDWLPKTMIETMVWANNVPDDAAFLSLLWQCRPAFLGRDKP